MFTVTARLIFRCGLCCWALVFSLTLCFAQQEEPVFSSEDALPAIEQPTRLESPSHPATAYWNIVATMTLSRPAFGTQVKMLLPLSDGRQSVLSRRASIAGAAYREETDGLNLWGQWVLSRKEKAPQQLAYEYTVQIADARVDLPQSPFPIASVPSEWRHYLQPSPLIQSDDVRVKTRARRLFQGKTTVAQVAQTFYTFVAELPTSQEKRGKGDALSVLTTGKGDRAGKTRALVALLRAAGIPARIVGGIRLGDAPKKQTTISWVEARLANSWIPMDPAGGYFAWLPNTYLALYRNDLPLLIHTRQVPVEYAFAIRQVTRGEVLTEDQPALPGRDAAQSSPTSALEPAHAVAAYVDHPLANVVVVYDHPFSAEESAQVLAAARENQINVTLLKAAFPANHFREQDFQLLIRDNLALLREADLAVIHTTDLAGFYALLKQGETGVQLNDLRLLIAGEFPWSVSSVLTAVLQRLVHPKEIVLMRQHIGLAPLWEIARAHVRERVALAESAAHYNAQVVSVTKETVVQLSWWRRHVVDLWALAVRSLVPLAALNFILVIPLIAFFLVIIRNVIGLETFGTFSPMLLSLAFLSTGLGWGFAVFGVIVGLGVGLRFALQRLRLHIVSRVAILIAVVAVSMVGLIVLGAAFGVGALLHANIFPMVIMANTIENFSNTQLERGTAEALRLTMSTLLVATCSYLGIEESGLKPLVLTFPELLIGVIGVELLLGRWRGLRLLEYVRFRGLMHETPSPQGADARKVSIG